MDTLKWAYHRLGNTYPLTDALIHEYNMWLASSKLHGHDCPPVPVGMVSKRREDGSLPLPSKEDHE